MCLFMPVPFFLAIALYYELKSVIVITPAVLFRIILAILMVFFFLYAGSHMKLKTTFFKLCEYLCWNFGRDCIRYVDCPWWDGHFHNANLTDPCLNLEIFPSSGVILSLFLLCLNLTLLLFAWLELFQDNLYYFIWGYFEHCFLACHWYIGRLLIFVCWFWIFLCL